MVSAEGPHLPSEAAHSINNTITRLSALSRMCSPCSTRRDCTLGFPVCLHLVCSGGYADVAVWDVQRRCLVMLLQQHPVCVEQLAFSPDGCWLVSVGSGRVVVWDIATGRATAVGAVKQVRVFHGCRASPLRRLSHCCCSVPSTVRCPLLCHQW